MNVSVFHRVLVQCSRTVQRFLIFFWNHFFSNVSLSLGSKSGSTSLSHHNWILVSAMASWHSYLVWPDTSLMIHGKLHSQEKLSLWLAEDKESAAAITLWCHEYSSWVLQISLLPVSFSNHKYPQQFLKKCQCCCVLLKVLSLSLLSLSLPLPFQAYYLYIMLPPVLTAQPMGCLYPPCCLHAGRQEQNPSFSCWR